MGLGASKTNNNDGDQVNSVRKQIGKRSSVSFFQRQDTKVSQAVRVTSFSAQVKEEEDEDSDDEGPPPPPKPLASHPVNIPPLSPSSAATVVRLSVPVFPPIAEISAQEAEITTTLSEASASSNAGDIEDHIRENVDHRAIVNEDDETFDTTAESCSRAESRTISCGSSKQDIDTPEADSSEAEEADLKHADEPITPLAAALDLAPPPLLRAFTPMAHESPTIYGFDEAMETARAAIFRDGQKKRATTGPELFKQALALQSTNGFINVLPQPMTDDAYTNTIKKRRHTINGAPSQPCRTWRPPRSKSPPADIFRKAQMKQHSHTSPQSGELSPRLLRLLRRPWPANLLQDDIHPSHHTRYALALPLTITQRACYGRHRDWVETNNLIHPVECAICLCASDCPADTAVAWMCQYCALRVCVECRAAFEAGGMRALIARYADGSKTVEAKKGRAIRRTVS